MLNDNQPGSGKTVLAGRVTERMLEQVATSLGQDLCLYYFVDSMASSVAEAEEMTSEDVIKRIFDEVPVP